MSNAVLNPYASPATASATPQREERALAAAGVWRQGDLLVLHKDASLPLICPVTNEPAAERQPTTYEIAPPWAAALVLAGPIGIGLSRLFVQSMTVEMPVSASLAARRWRCVPAILGGVLVCGLLLAIASQTAGRVPPAIQAGLLIGGLGTFIMSLIYVAASYGATRCAHMTETHVWISGADPEYLRSLPERPGELV